MLAISVKTSRGGGFISRCVLCRATQLEHVKFVELLKETWTVKKGTKEHRFTTGEKLFVTTDGMYIQGKEGPCDEKLTTCPVSRLLQNWKAMAGLLVDTNM